MNKVILIGNLCDKPEAYTTQNGISRSTFKIAVQRRFANAQGVREADFFTVVAWRATADFCNKYLDKGNKVSVEGSIQNRSYDAQDGSKRWVTEIIAENIESLVKRDSGGENGGSRPHGRPQQVAHEPTMEDQGFTQVDDDDELPFE